MMIWSTCLQKLRGSTHSRKHYRLNHRGYRNSGILNLLDIFGIVPTPKNSGSYCLLAEKFFQNPPRYIYRAVCSEAD
jgi:hypothetical protein